MMDANPSCADADGSTAGEPPISEEGARQAMIAHAAATGTAIRERLGTTLDHAQLAALLEDSAAVRFPVRLVFDAGPLQPGELAYPVPMGGNPANGYIMYVHPALAERPADTVAAVVYALVVVNYGEAASGEVGEVFGAAVLGMERDDYYRTMCRIADHLIQ